MQAGLYLDQIGCRGHFTCTMARRLEGGVNADRGRYSRYLVASRSIICYSCVQPGCISACPISKSKHGGAVTVALVDRETCLVRGHSQIRFETCPHDVPQTVAERDAKVQMFNSCLERCHGRKKLICVGISLAKACRPNGMILMAVLQQVAASTPDHSRQYSRALAQDIYDLCNQSWDAIQ